MRNIRGKESACSFSVGLVLTERRRATCLLVAVLTAAALKAGDYAYTTNGGLVTITGYSGPGGCVVIPSEIEGLPVGVIAKNAFAGHGTLTSVVIPDSVTTVDCGAFRDCGALADVTVGQGIFSIGREAFYGCSGVTNLTLRGLPQHCVEWDGIPNGLPFTLWCALDSPSYAITVEEGVTEIFEEAFECCHGLRSVALPQGLTNIRCYAFGDCPMLGGIVIPPGVTNIGRGAFSGCTALTSASIPDGARSIGEHAFAGCGLLGPLVFPDSVRSVGFGAFCNCGGLTDVTVGRGIATMGAEAFFGCVSVTNVTMRGLPAQYVGWTGAPCGTPFTLSWSIDSPSYSVTVEEGVTEIFEEAFVGCRELRSVALPQGLTNIGHFAFYDCPMLGGIVIPPGVTNIGRWAFYGCTALASASIPDGVRSIGERAFSRCGLQGALVLPDGVRSVGSQAFRDCGSLADVTVGSGIVAMGTEAFYGCGALTNITFRGLPELILNEFGEPVMPSFYYVFDSPAYAAVIAEGAAEIQAHAFEGCAGLTRISLPSSLAKINTPAFGACCQLESFAVSGANPRYYSLNGVLLDGAERALVQCPMRKAGDCTVPANVTRLADSAFDGCALMDGLYFKGDAPALGESVFSGTDGLIAYRLPAASGWGETLGGIPVVLWNPQVQAGAAFGLSAEGFAFTVGNAGSATVVVEACTNLAGAAWEPVGVLSGGANAFCDPNWREHRVRYYRLNMP